MTALGALAPPAYAGTYDEAAFKKCIMAITVKESSTSSGLDRAIERCDRDYLSKDGKQTFRPDSSYYEFKTWEANEDYKRDVEAINRDYDLRQAGVLP